MVRWKEKDTDEARYSDYEILDALNEVIRYVGLRLANKQSDLMERTADYGDENANYGRDGALLPEDFVSLKGVYWFDTHYRLHAASDDHVRSDTFRLSGGRIYVNSTFHLEYYGRLPETFLGGYIDLPDSFTDLLVKLTRRVLNNTDVDAMTETMAREVDEMVPRRNWNNMRSKMPFYV